MPKDFNRQHLNAAAPGLIAPGYLRGDEPVVAVGVSPEGRLTFSLPGIAPFGAEVRPAVAEADGCEQSAKKRPPPSGMNLIVLTFDDGFRNFYTEAFPVLQQHGFTATVFLPTAFIGDRPRAFARSRVGSACRVYSAASCFVKYSCAVIGGRLSPRRKTQ